MTARSRHKDVWRFSPVDTRAWTRATHRVLVVGADPNGDNEAPDDHDMGTWFRDAATSRFFENPSFYHRTLAHVAGAMKERTVAERWILGTAKEGDASLCLPHLRYADLKQTAGKSRAAHRDVRAAAERDLAELLALWCPAKAQPPAPTITVVQGTVAQSVFARIVLPALRAQNVTGSYVGVTHPSGRTSNDALVRCVRTLAREARDFAKRGVRWKQGAGWVPWDDTRRD
jgi:hypothetical protein